MLLRGKRAIELGYHATAKQGRFHASRAPYRLYGGAAGGGKSEAILFEAVMQCLEHAGIRGLVLRRTFPELERSLIQRALEKIPREIYQYNTAKHIMTFPNGSVLEFGFSECDVDVIRFQSAEYGFIGFDELTHFTEYQWRYLKSRCRSVIKGVFPNMFAGTNPGNRGHAWVKRLWIEKQLNPEEQEAGERARDYDFIPAKVRDNPYLVENDPGYLNRLASLPPAVRRALLEGDWDLFEGQVFTEFRKEIHVVPSGEYRVPSLGAWWPRWRAIDWGYTQPACCLWFCREPKGRTYVYRELYKTGMLVSEFAKRVKEMDGGEQIETCYLDPACWQKSGAVEQSISEQFAEHFSVQPADNDRLGGKQLVHEMLRVGCRVPGAESGRGLQIFENCTNLIRTLPQLVYDTVKVEDVDSDGEDHAYDALRYGLKSAHQREAEKPYSLRAAEFIAGAEDPTVVAMRMRKFEAHEQRAARPVRWR
ncbi:MAG TPA: phage terminase large subunit [Candidatus Acidoferrales bacterium]